MIVRSLGKYLDIDVRYIEVVFIQFNKITFRLEVLEWCQMTSSYLRAEMEIGNVKIPGTCYLNPNIFVNMFD